MQVLFSRQAAVTGHSYGPIVSKGSSLSQQSKQVLRLPRVMAGSWNSLFNREIHQKLATADGQSRQSHTCDTHAMQVKSPCKAYSPKSSLKKAIRYPQPRRSILEAKAVWMLRSVSWRDHLTVDRRTLRWIYCLDPPMDRGRQRAARCKDHATRIRPEGHKTSALADPSIAIDQKVILGRSIEGSRSRAVGAVRPKAPSVR